MEQVSTSVDTIWLLQKQQLKSKGQTGSSRFQQGSGVCRQCGFSWPHVSSPCPAIGRICNNCGKPNHFAKMCLTRSHTTELPQTRVKVWQKQKSQQSSVRHIQIESKELELAETSSTKSTSNEEGIFTIGNMNRLKVPMTNIDVNDVTVKVMIDTGTSTDIIDEPTYQLIEQGTQLKLEPDSCQIFAYGSKSQLKVLGKFTAKVKANNTQKVTTSHTLMISGAHGSLLSYSTAKDLGLVCVFLNNIIVADIITMEKLMKEYPAVFQGIGKLKDCEVKLHIGHVCHPSCPIST